MVGGAGVLIGRTFKPIFHEGKTVRIYFQEVDGEFHIVCAQFGVEDLGLLNPSPSH